MEPVQTGYCMPGTSLNQSNQEPPGLAVFQVSGWMECLSQGYMRGCTDEVVEPRLSLYMAAHAALAVTTTDTSSAPPPIAV